jgi:ubiquinone/menaquinone biosynthesis C-methylase UbiE
MWGLDRAEGMLAIARQKAATRNLDVQFVQGEMQSFDLNQRFDAVICTYDSINYALSEEDLAAIFKTVSTHLEPSGLFIFDVTTEKNIAQHFHAQTFAENREDYSYIWKNIYSYHNKICHTDLTFFIREDELFRRFEEVHVQKIFEVRTVKKLLNQTGYKMLGAHDMYTFNRLNRHSDRINFTVQKQE